MKKVPINIPHSLPNMDVAYTRNEGIETSHEASPPINVLAPTLPLGFLGSEFSLETSLKDTMGEQLSPGNSGPSALPEPQEDNPGPEHVTI